MTEANINNEIRSKRTGGAGSVIIVVDVENWDQGQFFNLYHDIKVIVEL